MKEINDVLIEKEIIKTMHPAKTQRGDIRKYFLQIDNHFKSDKDVSFREMLKTMEGTFKKKNTNK